MQKEYNQRQEAKTRAEHLTPADLRKFVADRIKQHNSNANLTVLEPAIGSGQMAFDINEQISHIDGYDVSEQALKVAKENFQDKLTAFHQDFITSKIDKEFDIALANYPFSLPPTEEQKEFISNDPFLKQFYDKNQKEQNGLIDFNELTSNVKANDVNGKLDFVFILKSFFYAKEGYYLAFPSIGYRSQELNFRKYLIDNKLIKEIGQINNAGFENTTISILYIHLTKEPNEKTKSFTLDLKTNEMLEGFATFENYTFDYPRKEAIKEYIDPAALEKEIRESVIKNLVNEIGVSRRVYEIDAELRYKLPTIEEWKQEIIKAVREC